MGSDNRDRDGSWNTSNFQPVDTADDPRRLYQVWYGNFKIFKSFM